jgi:hypothetical protein
MTRLSSIGRLGPASVFAGLLSLQLPCALAAQIAFDADYPRTLVFIEEEGRGKVASREMTSFLVEAGFPVIDPGMAIDQAAQELVAQANNGNNGAATQLGRDWGAQVLVLGVADYATRPDPVSGTLVTATTFVSVRALRLDLGLVVSESSADARAIDATDQAARTKAIRDATQRVISDFIGPVVNDWEARPWQEASYWVPDPGSVEQSTTQTASRTGAPGIAVTRADVLPSTDAVATRGIGVVRRSEGGLDGVQNVVRLEGVVVGNARTVEVDGAPAIIEPLPSGDASLYGLDGSDARKFSREFTLPVSQDSVRIVASGSGGQTVETFAAPRIDKRWAVVIGVGQYEAQDIPDLDYAPSDARAVRDFLQSDAAGPFDEVLYLEDEQATGAAMREALFVFLQQADWDDLVVIYYAGHGAPDPGRPGNLYLLPTDTRLDALAATGFPMWDVKTALRRQIAAERVIVIADACHSAGTADGETVGGGDSNEIAGGFQQLFSPSRRLMMTAADTNEFSLEDARWGGHGVFTHFLLDGLRGAGDRDSNGIVTFTELFQHVSGEVRTATNGRQNPQMSGLGDVPLAVVQSGQ